MEAPNIPVMTYEGDHLILKCLVYPFAFSSRHNDIAKAIFPMWWLIRGMHGIG